MRIESVNPAAINKPSGTRVSVSEILYISVPRAWAPKPNRHAQQIPPVMLKKKKRAAGMRLAPASKAANIRSTAIKRPKNTTGFPYRKNRYRPISNRFSSRRMYRPYLRRRGVPKRRPTRVSDPISDDRTYRGRGYNDSDIDLIGGCGQEGSSNKDRLSGKGHAGAF